MDRSRQATGRIFKIKRFSVHDGPGIRTAIFLKGCPLNCIWCHSPEGIDTAISIWYNRNICILCGECTGACPNLALEMTGEIEKKIIIDRNKCTLSGDCVSVCPTGAIQYTGFETTAEEVVSEAEKDLVFYQTSGGGVTVTGGEPLAQIGFLEEILKKCKKKDIHTAIETSLYAEKESIKRIIDITDLFLVDLKIFDGNQHQKYTGKSNEIILDNFRFLSGTGKKMIVRIPVIENITDIDSNLKAVEVFVKEYNDQIQIEKINYNPLAGNNYKRLGLPFLLK
jgi:pyruvate formate lyase activating enzyme